MLLQSISEDGHKNTCLAELELLVLGSYLAESFTNRINSYGLDLESRNLPTLRFNATNAFVGIITDGLDDSSALSTTNEPVWPYKSFLAVPLLQFSEDQEEKFSGNCFAVGGNTGDSVGELVDAFAHHTLEDTNGDLVFADLQGVFDFQARTIYYIDYLLKQALNLATALK